MKGKAKAAEFVDEGYKINVTGRNVLVTEAMKDYAIDKVSKIEKFSTRIIEVVITMDIQKLEHRVDIVLKVDHIKIKSHASSNDMYASIDQAVHKIERQLRKYKQRIQEHQAKSVHVVDMNVNVLRGTEAVDTEEINADIEAVNRKQLLDTYKPHEVVSRETIPLKTLTIDESIMKMELSGDQFLIFRQEEDNKLKAIYRRNDGNYGLIDIEK